MSAAQEEGYLAQGGSWRPCWLAVAVLGGLVVVDAVLPGSDVPPLLWAAAAVLVPTRAPAQLAEVIRTAHPAPGASPAGPGRVDP